MNHAVESLHCSIVRGGTSKGIFIMKNRLPADRVARDRLILAVFGSPDIRQIDGLGGADSLTSKLAIIGPSTHPDADVDYTFAQVSITDNLVDYGGNCGNISAGVGPFAMENGLVATVAPMTTVRIHMTNTGRILQAEVPVHDGHPAVDGDCVIDGVPGTGARIAMDWSAVVGGCTGRLLPTGQVKDVIACSDGRQYTVSVVDAGNIVVFVRAEELGLSGTETADSIDADAPLMARIEELRGRVCEKIGLVSHWDMARKVTPYQPFFAVLSKPVDHDCVNGIHVAAADADIVSRLLFMLKMHKAYPITGTVCTGAAARIPGTVAWELLHEASALAEQSPFVRIAHPSGTLTMESRAEQHGDETRFSRLGVYRTARILMDGCVYVRKSVLG